MSEDDADRLLGWRGMLLGRLCVWGCRKGDGRGRQWSGAGRVCCLKRRRRARVLGRRRRGWGRQVSCVLQKIESTLVQMGYLNKDAQPQAGLGLTSHLGPRTSA